MSRFAFRRVLSCALALGSVALLGACDDIFGDDDDDREVFRAVLQPLNAQVGGNVVGTATFVIDDGQLTASVEATGLDPVLHPQHIHAANQCPTAAADANNDGFIDVVEGVPSYGPILVPLDGDLSSQPAGQPDGFPQGQTIDYTESVSLSALLADLRAPDPDPNDPVAKLGANEELNLEGRHVVVHGVMEDLPNTVASIGGLPAKVTLPVACGTIVRVDD